MCGCSTWTFTGRKKNVRWHPEQEILFSCSYDDTIKIWKEEDDDWGCSYTLSGHKGSIWDICFLKKGELLASCSDDKTIKIWDLNNFKSQPTNICTISGFHKRTIYSIDYSNDGYLVTASADDSIQIFAQNPESKEISFIQHAINQEAHQDDVNCVSWNPTQKNIFASCSDDTFVKIWELVEK